jgi:hypothetical protein
MNSYCYLYDLTLYSSGSKAFPVGISLGRIVSVRSRVPGLNGDFSLIKTIILILNKLYLVQLHKVLVARPCVLVGSPETQRKFASIG